jgi:uncharacterized protein YecE (DUF72 family)
MKTFKDFILEMATVHVGEPNENGMHPVSIIHHQSTAGLPLHGKKLGTHNVNIHAKDLGDFVKRAKSFGFKVKGHENG